MLVILCVGCGPPEKDCWRGYDIDEETGKAKKHKVYCDDCCRVCRNSKPCGDGCISLSYTCHSGEGCACKKL